MREWIVTNGLGSYASLTNSNENTRKFHGLLISSLNPPLNRWIFISNVEDKICTKEQIINLNKIKPNFNFDYFPSFKYSLPGIQIIKTIFMPEYENTTIIKYKITTNKSIKIKHTPIINSRHFYEISKKNSFSIKQETSKNQVNIFPNNTDEIIKITLKKSKYYPSESWKEIKYQKDKERKDTYIDNNLSIGSFEKKIKKRDEYYLILSTENKKYENINSIYKEEIRKRRELFLKTGLPKKFKKLILSTNNFIVKKGNGKTVIAGYHWFSDWGRDTLISLPGLTLVTSRFNIAKLILNELIKYCKDGLIPNVFIDKKSEASYNSVDTSLWFIDRIFQYLKYTNDNKFLMEIWPKLVEIIDYYRNGTSFNIFMDEDFLISHDPGLTWMDVKIDNYYPTPRSKKAVEIQALWYNSLRIMSILSKKLGENDEYFSLSQKVKNNFNNKFDKHYDVIDNKDLSIRPNQIFLVSLDFSMIDKNIQSIILNRVDEELCTIFGLRSLSPNDPEFKGKYIDNYNRDIGYHNGVVWPWLLGPFIKSFIKINNNEKYWRKYAYNKYLKTMFHIFGNNWDGSINEIYDGIKPFIPRGCITQAWSVAEILRTWVEDIENIKPIYEKNYLSHEICI
jgi:predicted glycogen debranching enzyme